MRWGLLRPRLLGVGGEVLLGRQELIMEDCSWLKLAQSPALGLLDEMSIEVNGRRSDSSFGHVGVLAGRAARRVRARKLLRETG